MADTRRLGRRVERRVGSSPTWGTMILSLVSLMGELRLYTAVAAVQFCHEVPSFNSARAARCGSRLLICAKAS